MNAVVVVTGASRGIGRGIALALLEHGATVHATARTLHDADAASSALKTGSLKSLQEEADALPGEFFVHQCDHADDGQTEAVIGQIVKQHSRIDILVNNAWPGYENMVEGSDFTWACPFWQQPLWRWNAMIDVGLRSTFVASRAAAPSMIEKECGLIVNISFWAAEVFDGNAIYGLAKAGANKLAADFAHDLRPHGVAAVALYPGLVRTEAVMRNAAYFDLSNSESPRFIGRVVAGLWHDPALMQKSGGVHVAASLAKDYGILDIDGTAPKSLTRADFKQA